MGESIGITSNISRGIIERKYKGRSTKWRILWCSKHKDKNLRVDI